MAIPKDRSSKAKLIDVTEPGKSEPSATSRPIIVTNRPILQQDPMVVSDDTLKADELKSPSDVSIKIEPPKSKLETTSLKPPSLSDKEKNNPLSSEKESDNHQAEAKDTDNSLEAKDSLSVETIGKPAKLDEPTEETDNLTESNDQTSTASSDLATKDSDAEKKTTPSKETTVPKDVIAEAKQKEAAAKAAKQLELDKLIASKKYFLPINSVAHRKGNRRLVIILIGVVLLALVWVDLMLDAGIVKIQGIHALTNFFQS